MEAIDLLSPGIYEAVITDLDQGMTHPELIGGDYLMTFNRRSLDDVRAICQPNADDDRQLRRIRAPVGCQPRAPLQYNGAGPLVRMMSNDTSASLLRQMHPNRLRFAIFSDGNPVSGGRFRDWPMPCRQNRQPAASGNPWSTTRHHVADAIEGQLKIYGSAMVQPAKMRSSPFTATRFVQALAGIGIGREASAVLPESPAHHAAGAAHDREVLTRIAKGGVLAAAMRALVHVGNALDTADERSFAAYAEALKTSADARALGAVKLRALLHDQQSILRLAPEAGLAAIPAMLDGTDAGQRANLARVVDEILRSSAPLTEAAETRLAEMVALIAPKLVDQPAQTHLSEPMA